MSIFKDILEPDIFWIAIGSISTSAGVLIALFQPTFFRWSRLRNIEEIIRQEIKGNAEKFKNVSNEDSITKDGQVIDALSRNDAIREHINLSNWHEFRYELAASKPERFKIYKDINLYVSEIMKLSKEHQPHAQLRLWQQGVSAAAFKEKFEDEFPSPKPRNNLSSIFRNQSSRLI